MKRPSFQFYPGDWTSDLKLRRCSPAARGVWVDILCAFHDSDDGYGLLRWPLREIANTVGASMAQVKELVDKGVLRGSDSEVSEAFVYIPRSGRKDGEPVTLIGPQAGPIWYSKRLVKDEYVRTIRGESTRFGEPSGETPKPVTKGAPKPPLSDGTTSSSSSSPSVKEISTLRVSSPGGDQMPIDDPALAKPTKAKRVPACPYAMVFDAYHEQLPDLPKVRLTDDAKRKAAIQKLWKWVFTSPKSDGQPRAATLDDGVKWVRGYFGHASQNDFIMGRTQRAAGHEGWRADFDFLISDKGLKQVIEKTRAAT